MAWLSIQNLSKKINNNTIVNNINFSQEQQQNIAIAGATRFGQNNIA
ncbi:MAG: hypothetical protein V9E96_10570 [Chitinophagaceae bacterium]